MTERPENMRDLAFTLIRVMDDDGNAVWPWTPDLPAEELKAGLRHMFTCAYDARMLIAQRQGKTSFYMQHLGEEAIDCGFQGTLRCASTATTILPCEPVPIGRRKGLGKISAEANRIRYVQVGWTQHV